MRKSLYLFLLFSLLINQSYAKENIVENLIEIVIEKNLPYLLYQHTDQKWDMGIYSLTIERLAKSTFVSSDSHINLSFPVQANIDGKIKKNIFGTKIAMDCKSKFVTDAKIKITPTIKADNSKSTSTVILSIKVPPTNLDCDGLMLPIQAVLEALIQEKKKTWELKLESNINNFFTQAGI
jgi:hypothetical protein